MSCCRAAVMSSRMPAELRWQEHSKPAIQNEFRSGGSASVMGGVVAFARNHILLPLIVHQAIAPLQLELKVPLGTRAPRRQRDVLDRKLGGPVGVEKAVGLLVGVGELRVTKARENRQRAHDLQQMQV